MTEDTLIPRPRYWRKEKRLRDKTTMELVGAYHWYGQRSLSWCADLTGVSKSTAHRLAHKITREDALAAAKRFGLVKVSLEGIGTSNALVAGVDLENVSGSTIQAGLLTLGLD